MDFMKAIDLMGGCIELPTKEFLDELSFKASFTKSTGNMSVTDDVIDIVTKDAQAYFSKIAKLGVSVKNGNFRVKTPDSIKRKVERKAHMKFQSIFNDLLGIRLVVPYFPKEYPDYFRVVDMSNGKADDDGYRAVHLYYKKDNSHYVIEIQLWLESDLVLNKTIHSCGYKVKSSQTLLDARKAFDSGIIKTKDDIITFIDRRM